MLPSRTHLISAPLLSSDDLQLVAAHGAPLCVRSVHDIVQRSKRGIEPLGILSDGHTLPAPRRGSASMSSTAAQRLQQLQSLHHQCFVDGIDAQLLTTSMRIAENARIINSLMHRRQSSEAVAQAVFEAATNERRAASRSKTLADPFLHEALRRERSSSLLSVAFPQLPSPSRGASNIGDALLRNAWASRQGSVLASSGLVSAATSLEGRVSRPLDVLSANNVGRRHSVEEFRTGASPSSGNDKTATCASSRESQAPKTPLKNVLGIDQDVNWLSECQVLLRADFLEVTQVSRKDFSRTDWSDDEVKTYMQFGIRCRFCAHLTSGQRVSRSSAFPSSITQLYQSFTMMQRDHFPHCGCIPVEKREQLESLRASNSQGACDSRQYWTYAAKVLGMFDTPRGIEMTKESIDAGLRMPNFGIEEGTTDEVVPNDSTKRSPETFPEDSCEALVVPVGARLHPLLRKLLPQLGIVKLLPCEKTGKRKALPLGFSGIGCRCCSKAGRFGLSRIFPLRRRTLPAKLDDMLAHVLRCPLTPREVKADLVVLCGSDEDRQVVYQKCNEQLDQVWSQLRSDGYKLV